MYAIPIRSSVVFKILVGWIVVGITVVLAVSSGMAFPRWVPLLLLTGTALLTVTGVATLQNETKGTALTVPSMVGWVLFIGLVFILSRTV